MLPRWARGALALFLGSFWLSSAFVSQHPGFSLASSLGWVIHLMFAGALFHLVRLTLRGEAAGIASAMAPGFVAGLAAMAVLIAVHFTVLPPEMRGLEDRVSWNAAIPGFISARLFGAWCGTVLALLTGLAWIRTGGAREQQALHLSLMLVFGLTFWTTTRAALLAELRVLPVAWMLAGPPRSRAFFRVLPWYLLAGACLTIPLVPSGHSFFLFVDYVDYGSVNAVASGRPVMWTNSLQVAAQYPWLVSGAGSSFWLVPHGGMFYVQPHNFLMQFLLNWGLVPKVPALVLLGGGALAAHRAARNNPAVLPVLLMLDALLVMAVFDGMLHFAQFVMLISGCLAICLAQGRVATASVPSSAANG